jgi:NADPH:quinone reductase-like Zn-dependent oxidoreductase
VITTAAADNHDFVRQLGAQEVIDYAKVHFEDEVSDVDVVLDTIGGARFSDLSAFCAKEGHS